MTDFRAAWVCTCVFWAWTWAVGSFILLVFTFGFSLLMLIPAALSAWAVVLPVGKPQPAVPYTPPARPVLPSQHYPAQNYPTQQWQQWQGEGNDRRQ